MRWEYIFGFVDRSLHKI